MLRHIIAVSLIVLGTGYVGPVFGSETPARDAGFRLRHISTPMVGETMEDSVAHMVARAAAPKGADWPLTDQDRLKLYILLSLEGEGRMGASGLQ